jgi:hypothetical protein
MGISDHIRGMIGSRGNAEPQVLAEGAGGEGAATSAEAASAAPNSSPPVAEIASAAPAPAPGNLPALEAPVGAAEAAADPADVAEFCSANGCASMAAGLIREKAPMSEVKNRVNSAGAIRELVAEAGKVTPSISAAEADGLISAGLSVEQARAKLWDKIVARQSPEIQASISSEVAAVATQSAHKAGWDKAISKVNARLASTTQPQEG